MPSSNITPSATKSATVSANISANKAVSFNELGLSKALVKVLPANLCSATQVQLLAIPPALNGQDILALAQTGSGKTLAFGLVLLEKLVSQPKNKPYSGAEALVIVPTRELAQQVFSVLNDLANQLGIRCQLLCGGQDVQAQHLALDLQPQLIVATPGRLLAMAQGKSLMLDESLQLKSPQRDTNTPQLDSSHQRDKSPQRYDNSPQPDKSRQRDNSAQLNKRPQRSVKSLQPIEDRLKLTAVNYFVLDEADRLLEMGFWPDIQKIIAFTPNGCQRLFFSATLPASLGSMVKGLLNNPAQIKAHAPNSVVSDTEESAYLVNKGSKAQALIEILKQAFIKQGPAAQQALVFINGKDDADSLTKKLNRAGLITKALHGDKEQAIRDQTLSDFKDKKLQVIVATDLLARGIHLDALPLVVNFTLPDHAPTYVHRLGRTGRAGAKGAGISLVCHGETQSLTDIEAFIGRTLPLQALAGFPVTDVPRDAQAQDTSDGKVKPKRPPRDKQANRRSLNKNSIKDFIKK
jgi:ATP-dependent RNA helicase RhlE